MIAQLRSTIENLLGFYTSPRTSSVQDKEDGQIYLRLFIEDQEDIAWKLGLCYVNTSSGCHFSSLLGEPIFSERERTKEEEGKSHLGLKTVETSQWSQGQEAHSSIRGSR